MPFLIHLGIMLISLIVIVFACILFTNAIEFLGQKLKLGNNATGSILAVFGTGLPEAIVPIVAILGVYISGIKIDTAQDIAQGAILGSPFMLSTLAMFLLVFVLMFKKRNFLLFDYKILIREYKYFLIAYSLAIVFSFNRLLPFKYIAMAMLISLYIIFVYRTIVKSRATCVECECCELYFSKIKNSKENFVLALQLILSLVALVLSSHYFVGEIKYFSYLLNVSPAILSLFITPFATELPECINSLIWLKQDKDDLAIANIVGAIVFQSTIVFTLGMALTTWQFSPSLLLNCLLTFVGAIIFAFIVLINKKITQVSLLFCGIIYFIYLVAIFLK